MSVQLQAQADRDACDRLLKAIFDRGLGQRQIARVTGIPLSTVQRVAEGDLPVSPGSPVLTPEPARITTTLNPEPRLSVGVPRAALADHPSCWLSCPTGPAPWTLYLLVARSWCSKRFGSCYSPDFSPRGEPRLKVSMVNIRTATPQINRFGTDAERGQSSEWEAVVVEKLRVLWSKA